jgi:hypothetical protein
MDDLYSLIDFSAISGYPHIILENALQNLLCFQSNMLYTSELIEDNTPRILLVAITCITQRQTIKLKGQIKNDNVTILIDTGSVIRHFRDN